MARAMAGSASQRWGCPRRHGGAGGPGPCRAGAERAARGRSREEAYWGVGRRWPRGSGRRARSRWRRRVGQVEAGGAPCRGGGGGASRREGRRVEVQAAGSVGEAEVRRCVRAGRRRRVRGGQAAAAVARVERRRGSASGRKRRRRFEWGRCG
ncbi:hypothetical protein PVAP13_8NG140101 [Panicum virgatum]|uniref:Uncharacterized protein n=1 Tax=Panicum virgatum TaxID=38727 RepID=A0A8T0PIE4_PANVG|nr:hypothetical protein PVAP13_8NG140101 [Panicum virgatum]